MDHTLHVDFAFWHFQSTFCQPQEVSHSFSCLADDLPYKVIGLIFFAFEIIFSARQHERVLVIRSPCRYQIPRDPRQHRPLVAPSRKIVFLRHHKCAEDVLYFWWSDSVDEPAPQVSNNCNFLNTVVSSVSLISG